MVLAVLLLSAGYLALGRLRQEAPVQVEDAGRTVKVTRGPLRRTVRASGAVSARDYAAIVAPRMLGRGGEGGSLVLLKLAKPGSRVKKGDVVAEFDRQSQLTRIDDQLASVRQADATIAKRRAETELTFQATEQSVRIAQAEMDKARLDLKTAEVRSAIDAEKLELALEETTARHKQLATELPLREASRRAELRFLEINRDQVRIKQRRAENNAGKMILRAPLDGIVVMQTTFRSGQFGQIQEGDQVYPGSYLMQIVDPAKMVLNAVVNQAESQQFRVGQKAEIRLDAYPDQVWRGRLIQLGAMASASSFGQRGGSRTMFVRQVPLRFSIDASDARIIPDLSASAAVVVEEAPEAVLAPLEALEQQNGKAYGRVRRGGGWERRQVHLGLTNGTHAVVLSGLQAGDELAR